MADDRKIVSMMMMMMVMVIMMMIMLRYSTQCWVQQDGGRWSVLGSVVDNWSGGTHRDTREESHRN